MLESFDNIEETVKNNVCEMIEDHCVIENDGIGSYEFWGQKCVDKGNEYVVFEGLTLEYDVTKLALTEEQSENLPSVSGCDQVTLNASEYSDGVQADINWTATGSLKQKDNKTFLVYEVKG